MPKRRRSLQPTLQTKDLDQGEQSFSPRTLVSARLQSLNLDLLGNLSSTADQCVDQISHISETPQLSSDEERQECFRSTTVFQFKAGQTLGMVSEGKEAHPSKRSRLQVPSSPPGRPGAAVPEEQTGSPLATHSQSNVLQRQSTNLSTREDQDPSTVPETPPLSLKASPPPMTMHRESIQGCTRLSFAMRNRTQPKVSPEAIAESPQKSQVPIISTSTSTSALAGDSTDSSPDDQKSLGSKTQTHEAQQEPETGAANAVPIPRATSPSARRMKKRRRSDDDTLWWREDEISGYSPGDPDETDDGINGVGYQKSSSEAWKIAQARRKQLDEWRIREQREARAARRANRNEHRVILGRVSKSTSRAGSPVEKKRLSKGENEEARMVHFEIE